MGRFSQKMARQPKACVSAPPSTGPIAMEIPTTPLHTPMARASSRGSRKVLVMIDMATGFSIEPPTAWAALKTISQPSPGASAHSSEPAVKITSPVLNTRRRPIRSAVEPDSMRKEASTTV